jgi:hypothetical protein
MQPVQHAPAAQAPPGHGVKSAALVLLLQTATLLAPPGQAVMPVEHGAPGLVVQVTPETHATQLPPLHPLAQVVSVGA